MSRWSRNKNKKKTKQMKEKNQMEQRKLHQTGQVELAVQPPGQSDSNSSKDLSVKHSPKILDMRALPCEPSESSAKELPTKQPQTKFEPQENPTLRFTPLAWMKLRTMRDVTNNEVGGFGITDADDLLLVKDFVIIEQTVSSASVEFDDETVSNFFEDQVVAGRKPEQFARIWLHTHPKWIHTPSSTDEETFARVFGRCDWAIMFILAKDEKTYARLRFNVGPGGHVEIPVAIDYNVDFPASDLEGWREDYADKVWEYKIPVTTSNVHTQTWYDERYGDTQSMFGFHGKTEPDPIEDDVYWDFHNQKWVKEADYEKMLKEIEDEYGERY